ncbi:unnamed protein product [Prunus brigantina]
MAWDLLYGEYHDGDQVRSVKLQNLRREFECARMRDDETLSGYLTRLNDLINQMKTFGEILTNEKLVQKVLISLSKPYDPICLVIENTKSLETVELQEVVAILKSQEQSVISDVKINGNWYIDSGCSNHMTGSAELLVDIRTNVCGKVQMPSGSLVDVAGIGSLVIETSDGKKYIREVMFLPGLKENLLSVGQMDEHGYHLLFEINGVCEGCQLGKQQRDWFPKGLAWRARNPLELIHIDLCGPMQTESIAGNRYFMLLIDDCTRMTWVYFLRYK